ncbi:MAG: hypothetical protein K5917_02530, partial [Clostridiales bacterium]|nr:hypothetical protein [Clostridiales bacterium]
FENFDGVNFIEIVKNAKSYTKSKDSTLDFNIDVAFSSLNIFKNLGIESDQTAEIIKNILACQMEDGFFATGYNKDGNKIVLEKYNTLNGENLKFLLTMTTVGVLSKYTEQFPEIKSSLKKALDALKKNVINEETGLAKYTIYYDESFQSRAEYNSIITTVSLAECFKKINMDTTEYVNAVMKYYDEEKVMFHEYPKQILVNEEGEESITIKDVKVFDASASAVSLLVSYLSYEPKTIKTTAVDKTNNITVVVEGLDYLSEVNLTNIDKTAESYKTLIKVAGVDEDKVIACVDVTPTIKPDGTVELTFTVGTDYAGQKVNIYHLKDDNTTENLGTFEVAADGTVSGVKVDSFSPFMITLEEAKAESTETTGKAVETAKTGDASIAVFGALAVVSLGAIVLTAKKKEN